MSRRLWIFICRVATYVSLSSLYGPWSHLYRLIWEWKYRNIQVPTFKSLKELQTFVATLNYIPDGWKQLWDAFSSPGAIQYRTTTEEKYIGDCDEFALYQSVAIENSLAAGVLIDKVANPRVMTLVWMPTSGWRTEGHNVCLMDFLDGGIGYMDYSEPHRFATVHECVLFIARQYGNTSTIIGWGVRDNNLKVIETHWQ